MLRCGYFLRRQWACFVAVCVGCVKSAIVIFFVCDDNIVVFAVIIAENFYYIGVDNICYT